MAKASQPTKSKETIVPLIGKKVFYQLTDAEGGTDEAGGRRSLAFISRVLDEREPNDPKANRFGRTLTQLHVIPVTGMKPFTVKAPLDSARTPGTWDSVQPADGDV